MYDEIRQEVEKLLIAGRVKEAREKASEDKDVAYEFWEYVSKYYPELLKELEDESPEPSE